MKRNLTLAVIFLFSLAAASLAGELATPWAGKGPAHSRLILESEQFTSTGVNRAGVQVQLEEGWWTYWRAPGSSGIPPRFDWSGSKNLADAPELAWPVPIRAMAYGESLNLYRNEIVFPIEFRAVDPTKPVTLHLKLTYGVCKNMCVPATAEHEIAIAPAKRQPIRVSESNVRLISAYSVRQPSTDPISTGLEIKEVWESQKGGQVRLGVRITGLQPNRKPLVLVEGPAIFQAAEVTPKLMADTKQSTLIVTLGRSSDISRLSGKRIRITVIEGKRALEQTWVVGAQSSSATGVGLTPISAGTGDKPEP